MGKQNIIFAIYLLVVLMVSGNGWGCAPRPPVVSHGGPARDYVSLIDNLRAAGARVEPAGEIAQPFFSVEGRVIKVNGVDVQVFEYDSEQAMEEQAKTVSPSGSPVGTTMISWVAPPHFYKAGRIMVLYVGDNREVIDLLVKVPGAQFAGR